MKVDKISASHLEAILTADSKDTLLLDCRPLLSFNKQRIVGAVHCFCPSILKRRFAAKGNLSLDSLLPAEVRRKLRNGEFKRLVMYEEADRDVKIEKNDASDVSIILQSLKFNSYELTSASLLTGGYKRFKSETPNLCTVLRPSGGSSQAGSKASPTCNAPTAHQESSKWSEPTQLLPHLYIGDEQHSLNRALLNRLGITAILNVSSTCAGHVTGGEFTHKVIPVRDSNTENISTWFTEALQFIDTVHGEKGKIMVHCKAGISRSATICIAYLMYHHALMFISNAGSLVSDILQGANQPLALYLSCQNQSINGTNQYTVHREKGKILVHCKAGISRSATICIAYLMYHDALSLEQAFEYVQSRRSIISPNMNFMRQLCEFERAVGRKVCVRDIIYPKVIQNCSPLPCMGKHTDATSAIVAASGYFNFNVCAMSQT